MCVWQAEVVSQTRINFNDKQLLQLIHQHLERKGKTSLEDDDVPIDDTTTKPLFTPQENGRKGLLETADALLREANITPPPRLPSNNLPLITITPKMPLGEEAQSRTLNSPKLTPFSSNYHTPSASKPETPSLRLTPSVGREPLRLSLHKLTMCCYTCVPLTPFLADCEMCCYTCVPLTPFLADCEVCWYTCVPLTPFLADCEPGATTPVPPSPAQPSSSSRFSKAVDKRPQPPFCPLRRQAVPTISLDSIVTEYLRTQHSLCKNPVVTCPSFDLFV
ncbi:VPRBP [Cordylochernes scorpioides]|uniref:VPRBP n=1 Tax=Cordylochernes scorpioides TaxID=51811 RepID=A0ABY6L8Y7_9ARAC|nr:VPRBP [Cordylochernes scorpioides]